MVDAQLVEKIRRELDRVELELRRHPYLDAHEAGRLRCDDLTRFAAEQGNQMPGFVPNSGTLQRIPTHERVCESGCSHGRACQAKPAAAS